MLNWVADDAGDTPPAATASSGAKWVPDDGGAPDATAIQAMRHNFWEDHVQNLAQKAYDLFAKHGHEDIGQAAYDLIYKGGPHSTTDAVLYALTALMPGVGKAAEGVEAASPILDHALSAVRALGGTGFKAAAARTGTAAGVGAATSAATGDSPIEGAEQGALLNVGGEIPEAAGRAAESAWKIGTNSPELLGGTAGAIRGEPRLIGAANEAAERAGQAGLDARAQAYKTTARAAEEAGGTVYTPGVEPKGGRLKARADAYETTAKEAEQAGQARLAERETAYSDTAQAGEQQRQKLQSAAGREAAQQGQAENKALDQTAEANMRDRSQQYQKAKEALAAGQTKIAESQQDVANNIATKTDQLAQQSVGGIRDRIIREATGRRPEQTEAAIHAPGEAGQLAEIPGPEFIARKKGFLDASYGPTQRMQDELSRQYDSVLGSFMDNPVEDITSPSESIVSERKWAADNGERFSTPVNKLFDDFNQLTQADQAKVPTNGELLKTAGYDEDQISSMLAQLGEVGRDGKPIGNMPQQIVAQLRQAALVDGLQQVARPVTVAQLRGFRSRAVELASKSNDAVDKAGIHAFRQGIEESLESAGVPGVKELNARYATFKNLFGPDFYHGIAKAKDPIDAAGLLFNEPQRSARLVNNASPEQLQSLRELYGDWVNREGGKVVDYKRQKPVLERLYHGTKLADPNSWIHLPQKLVKASDLLADDPEFNQAVMGLISTERTKNAKQLSQALLPLAQQMGPAGRPLLQAAAAAKTPEEAARTLITGLTGMEPEDAVRALAATQLAPENAAGNAGAGVSRTARSLAAGYQAPDPTQAVQGVVARSLPLPDPAQAVQSVVAKSPPLPDPTQAVRGLTPSLTTPQEAALGSLQSGAMTKSPWKNHMMSYAERIWPMMATFAGMDILSGRSPFGWHEGMAAIGISLAGTEVLRRSFINSLKDPANAERFWMAVQNPSLPASKGVLARGIVRMLGTVGMNAFMNDAPSPRPAPTDIKMPMAPEAPAPDKQPLPTLEASWKKAKDSRDTKEMNNIRTVVLKRLKTEWPNMSPKDKAQLGPWLRNLIGPSVEERPAA